MELSGQTVVVTGAASGIGAALAGALAQRGARLVLVDRDAEGLERIATPLGAAWRVVDVSQRAQLVELARWVDEAHGGAQVLINNAGMTILGRFEEHSAEDWERLMGVNLFGVVWGCQAFLPQLRRAPRAWIVNISSLFGLVGIPGQAAYCASKYAVRGLSEALHEELAGSTVGITVVHPGGVRTGIVKKAQRAEGAAADDVQDRLVTFFEQKAMSPRRAAEQILRAVERGQYRLRVCPETTLADWVIRLSPVAGRRWIVALLVRLLGIGESLRRRA